MISPPRSGPSASAHLDNSRFAPCAERPLPATANADREPEPTECARTPLALSVGHVRSHRSLAKLLAKTGPRVRDGDFFVAGHVP